MFYFLICLILSVLTSYGMAIALVEKGNEFPIKKYRVLLQNIIHKYVGWKWAKMLLCSTCSSFWLTLLSDIIVGTIAVIIFGVPYFFWPFSGFVTLGFTWSMIEYLNAIDKEENINVFVEVDKEKSENSEKVIESES